MKRKTTLAIIGRGHWGQVYKKTIDKMNSVVLPDQNIFGKDYERIKDLTTSEIDGVIIAASTSAHYQIASYLLRHGFKNLLIEKPLTQTYHQAKKLQKIIRAIPNAKVLVGHVLLYDPAYNKIKALAKKKLGKISQIIYTSLKTPPIKNSTVLLDAGSPPIYLFLDFAYGNPVKISAKPKSNDNIDLKLTFDNGLIAVAHIGPTYPERKRGIEIICEKGRLVLNEFVNPRSLIYIQKNDNKQNVSFSKKYAPLELEILEFANYIRNGKNPKNPYFQGIDVIRIVELAEKSLKLNGKIISMV